MASRIMSKPSKQVGDVLYVDDGIGGPAFRPGAGVKVVLVGRVVDAPTLVCEDTDPSYPSRIDHFTMVVPHTPWEGSCLVSVDVYSNEDFGHYPPLWIRCALPGRTVEVETTMDFEEMARFATASDTRTADITPPHWPRVKIFETDTN